MATPLATFEKWLREELYATSEITNAVGRKSFNKFATAKAALPYLIFNVFPLSDKFGQARTSIQTVLMCDVQIYHRASSDDSVHLSVDAAIEAFQERVRLSRNRVFEGKSIAVRHEKPISRILPGASDDEKILVAGSTYKAWISRA